MPGTWTFHAALAEAQQIASELGHGARIVPHGLGFLVLWEECTHPDHTEGVACVDRAVGCSPHCVCCGDRGTHAAPQGA